MKKQLPQYYCIKRDESNPLWKKYDKWTRDNGLNLLFGSKWDYIGFDGSINNNGFNGTNEIEYFKNTPELITLEFWDECVNGRKIVAYKNPILLYGIIPTGTTFKHNSFNGWQPVGFKYECNLPDEIVREYFIPVYEEEKLEVLNWYNYEVTNQSKIIFEGKLTQEIVDKIKEVINE